jgi:diguanylate cyclase (GGDEF)-like protein/PAS domain S-box-containing protein
VSSRKLMACYGLWYTVLTAVYYAVPSWHTPIWAAIGVSSAGAVIYGVGRNRPRRSAPWLLMAGAVSAFNCGDLTYDFLVEIMHDPDPFPSAVDGFYLLLFAPLLAGGVLLLARSGATNRDRASVLDALILTGGVGLLSWIFLIRPYVESPDLTWFEKLVSVAYPLYDLLILLVVIRLLVTVRYSTSLSILMAGVAGLLVSDVLYGLIQLSGHWKVGGPVDLGWIVFYAGVGAAALHPSMVSLTEPRVLRHSNVTPRRLLLLTLSSLIAPGVLLVEVVNGPVDDAAVIALFSAAMFLLVLARLSGVVDVHRRAVGRERALRDVAVALVSATEVTDVVEAARRAIVGLLPPGTDHHTIVEINAGTDPAEAGAAKVSTAAPVELRYVRDLDPALADQLGDFEITLCCPLTVPERRSGDPRVGTVFVAAAEVALVALQGAVEVLASQAALALERITLSNEINRRNSEAYFRTLVHNTADVILIVDDDNRIRYASPSAAAMFGMADLDESDGGGITFEEVIHPEDRVLAHQILDLVRSSGHQPGQHGERADWTVLRTGVELGTDPDSGAADHAQVEMSCRDLRHDGTVRGLVVTLRDVTERRRLERELTHRALYDSLTGLPNRALFQERLQQAVVRAQRTHAVVGVLVVDLDDFKIVNDTLGHEVGDDLLVAAGERLASLVRPHDTAARLGGDEFAVLITDAHDPSDIELVADRIIAALAEPFVIGARRVGGVASVGVATTAEAEDVQDLLRQADLALYVAKGGGKGQWCRYQSAIHTAVQQRLELRAALEKAVTNHEFTLVYQPIVALAGGSAVGLEALVRWNHPTRGTVLPGEFIEVAEESGLIVPIGGWVLEQAISTAAQWHQRFPGAALYISVNVSARQFRAAGFVDTVRRTLSAAGLPAECLLLEITESLLLRDDEQVWTDLAVLREIGIRVAIDDFGTGYSSLSYLRQAEIDVVKIDKSFVETVSSAPQQRALVEGIVQLARTLGLQVVAEGIEREVDRETLAKLGCPLGQGYLFARPLSYDDALAWLLAERVAA